MDRSSERSIPLEMEVRQMIRKIMKWLSLTAAVLFVAAQFIGPRKTNPPVNQTRTMQAHVQMTPQVAAIFDRACQDCHSHETRWPWYSQIAPVSWFVIDQVNHGR